MDVLLIALRILHILFSILWVGAAAFFFFYLEPAINKLGPAAEPFVDEVINRRKAPIYFAITSTLGVLGGVILYWRDSGGLQGAWIGTPTGIAFTLGGIAAIIAWIGGNMLIPPAIRLVGAIGAEMNAAGGPPTAELMGHLHAAQRRLRTIGLVDLVLLLFAVVMMESARYLG